MAIQSVLLAKHLLLSITGFISVTKPFLELIVIILYAFVAIVIQKHAKRQTVGLAVFFNASTASAVVRAAFFRAITLCNIYASHNKAPPV